MSTAIVTAGRRVKVIGRTTALAMLLASVGAAPPATLAQAAPASQPRPAPALASAPPNVVVILADDLGWPDVSTYGRSDVPTPNIDRIARTGVAFSNGYVAASVCSVSRAGLLTGRRPAGFGVTYNISDTGNETAGLPLSEKTLAERLKTDGYRTMAIGKWHQGSERRFYPTNRGFDDFFGFLGGETVYVDPKTPGMVTTVTKADKYPLDRRKSTGLVVAGPAARPVENFGKYLTTEITDRTISFIGAARNRPFFAYVAYNAPHWPLQAPQDNYDRFAHIKDPARRTYVAMISAVDDGVGRILDALERTGTRDNTIVVFLSDNGCPPQFGFCNPAHPWGVGKFTYLEGGIRVPFVMSWPAGLRPRGTVDTPVWSIDIVPTVLRAVRPRAPLPSGLDGVDLVDLLAHPPRSPRTLLWGQEPVYAARRGPLKLWRSQDWPQTDLYDIEADPAERNSLVRSRPDDVAALGKAVETWRRSLPKPLWPLHGTRRITLMERETEYVY